MECTPISINPSFYINSDPPSDVISPKDIICKIYHSNDLLDKDLQINIMKFIKTNNCTDSGNVTELSVNSLERFISMPCIIGILFHNNIIIGTIFTIILRVNYKDDVNFLTSYTTFLCVDNNFRRQGLATILIRNIMIEGYSKYNVNHGYYMTYNIQHNINNKIQSWYRPINVKRLAAAGFTLPSLPSLQNDRNGTRQRLSYHIATPQILPIKVTSADYQNVLNILKRGCLYLAPTQDEFEMMRKCFDIYTVGNHSMFMLFPMTSVISSTKKKITTAQLAMMVGDILSYALWVAKETDYDALYGWISGDITTDKVISARGLITTSESYIEFYNMNEIIPNDLITIPLF